MKIGLLAAAALLAGCAGQRSPGLNDRTTSSNRDLSECEREAAQASAGSKAQAFDSCMRARKQTPKR
jgi:hypothetical protein